MSQHITKICDGCERPVPENWTPMLEVRVGDEIMYTFCHFHAGDFSERDYCPDCLSVIAKDSGIKMRAWEEVRRR
jgi:hypothetical protein